MKESFLERARENLKIAELAFDNACYNASTNRAYYAAFHAAIAAIYAAGITPNIDHKIIRTLFSDYYFNKRKILPSRYNKYLRVVLITVMPAKAGIQKTASILDSRFRENDKIKVFRTTLK